MEVVQLIQEDLPDTVISKDGSESPEAMWATLFLKYGMEVYDRRDGDAPKARSLLRETAEAVYGSASARVVLTTLQRNARDDTSHPRSDEDVADLASREKTLLGVLLVYLAATDRHWSQAQHVYLDKVIPHLLPMDAADIHGWLAGSWPKERYRVLDAPLKQWAETERSLPRRLAAFALGFAKQNRRVKVTPDEFVALWERTHASIDAMQDVACTLGPAFSKEIERSRNVLQQMRNIRIVVLGEFNVGKSSLINRLIGREGFMPTDSLPSTSGIIEITKGDAERYFLADPHSRKSLKQVPREQFHKKAGDANARSLASVQLSDLAEAAESWLNGIDEDAQRVKQWRVELPQRVFSGDQRVTLVDTPGLNEDPVRDELARHEARGAHASVIVMNTAQPLTQYERDLFEIMAGQARGMTIVLNKADLAESPNDVRRARKRVFDHLSRFGICEEQVIAFSALRSEERRKGNLSVTVTELKQTIESVALDNVTPVCYGQLLDEVQRLSNAFTRKLNTREAELECDIRQLQEEREKREREQAQARIDIDTMTTRVRTMGETAAVLLSDAFEKAWPEIIDDLKASKDTWDTDQNPVFHPKKAAKEIADDAEKKLVGRIKIWSREEATPLLEDQSSKIIDQIERDLERVAQYIERVQGVEANEVTTRAISAASSGVFGVEDIRVNGKVQAAILIIVSLIVGYIIADIVLYYILSVIAGFLNPWLLAVAVVLALGVFLTGGREAVYRRIKGKVADKLEEKLTSRSIREDLRDGLRDQVEDVFKDFANAIRDEATSYVDESKHQFELVVEQMENASLEKEDIQENIRALREEVQCLEDLAQAEQGETGAVCTEQSAGRRFKN